MDTLLAPFEYVKLSYGSKDAGYLNGKYFAQSAAIPHPSNALDLNPTYATCRAFCLDGGGAHGTAVCEAFLWAPVGCKHWTPGSTLCLFYDGDNHGQAANVDGSGSTTARQCACAFGDDCYVFRRTHMLPLYRVSVAGLICSVLTLVVLLFLCARSTGILRRSDHGRSKTETELTTMMVKEPL